MRKILCFLLFTIMAKAQIVSIPNANFKAKLLATSTTAHIAYDANSVRIKIDTNNDGQIQVSEAQQVYILAINYSNISDLTGIQSFSNLRQLGTNGNQLTSLNVSGMVNLRSIDCAYNQISNLNVSNLNNLQRISCHNNLLTNLDLSGIGLTSLQSLYCQGNLLSNLNVIGLPALSILYCHGNVLTSLNISNMNSLRTLYCGYNSLVNLNISGLVNLSELECQNNQLTSINFTGLNSLYFVNCSYNNLSAIDLSVRPNEDMELDCSYNQNLITINSKDNQIFDDTQAPPPAPPGPHTSVNFQGTPNLQSICADGGELVYLQNKVNILGYTNPNCQISSTCPFTTNITTISTCISYTWPINNQVFTSSGVYKVVTGFHTEQLNLTINPICASVVNLKLIIESFYDIGVNAMRSVKNNQDGVSPSTDVDNLTIELHSANAPYGLVATTTGVLKTTGLLQASFNNLSSGSYYIAVKGSNLVQTWSALPQTIGSVALTYDFTTAASQAYGDNMKEVESGVFAFYSGDVDQNGNLDTLDYSQWEVDYNNFASGVFPTDIDGNGNVDTVDYTFWESNYNNFVSSFYPTGP